MSQFLKKNSSTEQRAKSVDEAVEAALKELNASKDDVDIEVIEEGSKGFLGIGAHDAVVRVTVKGAQNSSKNAADDSSKPKSIPENVDETAKEFLNGIFKAMNMEVQIDAKKTDDGVDIELSGENMGIVIGKRGDTLDSLQYLTSLVVNKGSDDYVKVSIDTENYREKRTETLLALSNRLAEKVTKTGKKFTLEPMNPYERRVIHSNLQNNENITTYSIGQEPYRKVVIAPKNAKYSKRDRDNRDSRRRDTHDNHRQNTPQAEKTGSYTTTYKADFKPTQHKAEYKNFEDYLAAQKAKEEE